MARIWGYTTIYRDVMVIWWRYHDGFIILKLQTGAPKHYLSWVKTVING